MHESQAMTTMAHVNFIQIPSVATQYSIIRETSSVIVQAAYYAQKTEIHIESGVHVSLDSANDDEVLVAHASTTDIETKVLI